MAANHILELQMHMSRKSKNKTDMSLECGRHIYLNHVMHGYSIAERFTLYSEL